MTMSLISFPPPPPLSSTTFERNLSDFSSLSSKSSLGSIEEHVISNEAEPIEGRAGGGGGGRGGGGRGGRGTAPAAVAGGGVEDPEAGDAIVKVRGFSFSFVPYLFEPSAAANQRPDKKGRVWGHAQARRLTKFPVDFIARAGEGALSHQPGVEKKEKGFHFSMISRKRDEEIKEDKDTMVENRKEHRQNSHPIIHCPTREGVSEVSERTSERSGRRERSKQSGASERASSASERASGPVLQSVFLAVFDHSERCKTG